MKNAYSDITKLIGQTPLIKLNRLNNKKRFRRGTQKAYRRGYEQRGKNKRLGREKQDAKRRAQGAKGKNKWANWARPRAAINTLGRDPYFGQSSGRKETEKMSGLPLLPGLLPGPLPPLPGRPETGSGKTFPGRADCPLRKNQSSQKEKAARPWAAVTHEKRLSRYY